MDAPSVTRTSAGLRNALFDEIDRLRRGETEAKRANAVARIASEIVNTVKMEMEVANFAASRQAMNQTDGPRLVPPVNFSDAVSDETEESLVKEQPPKEQPRKRA